MSVTYDIKCDDCKQTLWIGQRDHIYKTPEYIARLEKFLFNHIGHTLRFDADADNDYEVLDDGE